MNEQDSFGYKQYESGDETGKAEMFKSEDLPQPTFKNLGAPRLNDFHEESAPAVKFDPQPVFKKPSLSFKLINLDSMKAQTSKNGFKWVVVAVFLGIAVVSFVTQLSLTLNDTVIKVVAEAVSKDVLKSVPTNNTEGVSTKITEKEDSVNQNDSESEPLGSDDGADTSSDVGQTQVRNDSRSLPTPQNDYRVANVAQIERLGLSAKAFYVADINTGEVIFSVNENVPHPIASVSKLMTALIAREKMKPDAIAIVSRDSYNTYGAQGRLLLGEKLKVADLLYPLLMESSNDAAEVIADSYGHEKFLAEMNRKARALGMEDTYYEDPSGLNEKNTSTVSDLYLLAKYIKDKHPEIFDMTRVRRYEILKHTWLNKNRYLNYPFFLGGKNGYIDESRQTTVSMFEVQLAKGGKRQFVIIILKSNERERDAIKLVNFMKKNVYFKELDLVTDKAVE